MANNINPDAFRSPDLGGEKTKYTLDESQMPRAWYNIQADLPSPVQIGRAHV